MKKLYIVCSLMFTSLVSLAQCPAGDLVITTQAEVDAFATTYPGCTSIPGDLDLSSTDITNLDGLSSITYIGGSLIINGTGISNLNGLANVTSLGPEAVVFIILNESLSNCKINSTCAYLGTGGIALFFGNAQGCNSVEEVSSSCNSLPVRLTTFNARLQEKAVVLSWATASEINSSSFEIQHGITGKNWNVLASVEAKGESNGNQYYTYRDNTPANGNNLYRLKMIDLDGTFAYSTIKNVLAGEKSVTSVYPNPVSDKLLISAADLSKITSVRLFNTSGKKIYESTSALSGIDVKNLAAGAYFIQIIDADGNITTSKVMKF